MDRQSLILWIVPFNSQKNSLKRYNYLKEILGHRDIVAYSWLDLTQTLGLIHFLYSLWETKGEGRLEKFSQLNISSIGVKFFLFTHMMCIFQCMKWILKLGVFPFVRKQRRRLSVYRECLPSMHKIMGSFPSTKGDWI
jgi:hypothetical protein